jgi:hypothetical protein
MLTKYFSPRASTVSVSSLDHGTTNGPHVEVVRADGRYHHGITIGGDMMGPPQLSE